MFSSVQFSHSVVFDSLQSHAAVHQASLSITNHRSLPKLMSIKSVMPSNHLIFCCPLLLLPSFFPSIMVFSNESALCIRWPKYWSFSFNISPSNEHPGLISFRMDWLDLLETPWDLQGTLKTLLQHHSSKTSILQHPAFFIVQLSHPYMTTGKTIALTRWTLVGKVMPLLFNMLSRLVITFLPRSKRLLIPWLQSRLKYYEFIITSTLWAFLRVCMLHHGWLFATLWTVAYQPLLPMGFSGQEYWSGLPCTPPGDLPNPWLNLHLLWVLHCKSILYHWVFLEKC